MPFGIDIIENELIVEYPDVLDILLYDRTTQKNILWATENYEYLGEGYGFNSTIAPHLITGDKGDIIMPRVNKERVHQLSRSKEMAEVFTPSWLCNAQLNLIDNNWFGKKYVFNEEADREDGTKTWNATPNKIIFPKGKTWQDYINDTRLEVSCGEAPYIVSRYDTTTGELIAVENRIGILDRKLRVISENTNSQETWLGAAQEAYKSTYAFEWQGDNLLLAREAMLLAFVEAFTHTFQDSPSLSAVQDIANVISWNVWQMDGLKGVIPNSCTDRVEEHQDLFGNTEKIIVRCKGCETQNLALHTGNYCMIMDWKKGAPIRFIDLLNK